MEQAINFTRIIGHSLVQASQEEHTVSRDDRPIVICHCSFAKIFLQTFVNSQKDIAFVLIARYRDSAESIMPNPVMEHPIKGDKQDLHPLPPPPLNSSSRKTNLPGTLTDIDTFEYGIYFFSQRYSYQKLDFFYR